MLSFGSVTYGTTWAAGGALSVQTCFSPPRSTWRVASQHSTHASSRLSAGGGARQRELVMSPRTPCQCDRRGRRRVRVVRGGGAGSLRTLGAALGVPICWPHLAFFGGRHPASAMPGHLIRHYAAPPPSLAETAHRAVVAPPPPPSPFSPDPSPPPPPMPLPPDDD